MAVANVKYYENLLTVETMQTVKLKRKMGHKFSFINSQEILSSQDDRTFDQWRKPDGIHPHGCNFLGTS